MPTIIEIKKEREFYQDFSSLVEALKSIAVLYFHTLQKKIITFEDIGKAIEGFFELLDLKTIAHPFALATEKPLGVVAVTSDGGLLGGLNHKVMTAAVNYAQESSGNLIIVGQQGQNFAKNLNLPYKSFAGVADDKKYVQAQELRDYIIDEVLAQRLGAVKIIYPFARSIAHQEIIELDLLPCGGWAPEYAEQGKETEPDKDARAEEVKGSMFSRFNSRDIILESPLGGIIEYLAYMWIGQRFFEIFQFARLAEYGARIVHLEESSQKIKEEEKKLKLQYFRARREVIDQQMRELFAARI
ncbi:MAG: F0F1 ATP synthase subunit gamma [Candidatus Omnitrophica bacterium]|nr:F0F1 ATP synthase subunit gamma [Candidatus Omnitrophota bacterium]